METVQVIQAMLNWNIRQRDIAADRVDSEGPPRRRINIATQERHERAIDRYQAMLERKG